MTTHFVYPNVIPREGLFIGCGRYCVIIPGDTISGAYNQVESVPNTPNRLALEYGMQVLGPESFTAAGTVHEIKDQPGQCYQGDSLDLAYLLAHVNRSRKVKLGIMGDIWATGVIQTNDGKQILRKVDDLGFNLKMDSFLDPGNGDSLFIIPAANLLNSKASQLEAAGVTILTLSQIDKYKQQDAADSKFVLKILPNELSQLIKFLFTAPTSTQKKGKWFILFLFMLVLGLALPLYKMVTGQEELSKKNFQTKAAEEVQNTHKEQLFRPTLLLSGSLIYKKVDEAVPVVILFDSKGEFDNLTLSQRDLYRLELNLPARSQQRYLYVYQFDSLGNIDCIFPNKLLETINPIGEDQNILTLPGHKTEWFYLSKLDVAADGMIKEKLLFLMSETPLKDLHSLFEQTQAAHADRHRNVLVEKFLDSVDTLLKQTTAGISAREIWFWHID